MHIFVIDLNTKTRKEFKNMIYRYLTLFLTLLMSFSIYVSAQDVYEGAFQTNSILEKDTILQNQSNSIIPKDTLLNREPKFPGGEEAMNAFIKTKLKYPKKALKVRAEGRVILRVTIADTGEISNIGIIRGVYHVCDEEAIFVVRSMPRWTPGLKNGKPVAMQVIVPVPFEVPNEK